MGIENKLGIHCAQCHAQLHIDISTSEGGGVVGADRGAWNSGVNVGWCQILHYKKEKKDEEKVQREHLLWP